MADAQTQQFRMANASMSRMLGYSHEEFLNLTINDIHPEEELANVARQFERQLRGEIALATLPVKRKDGSVFYADINAAQVMIDGRSLYYRRFQGHHRTQAGADSIDGIREHAQERFGLPWRMASSWRTPKPTSSASHQ